MKNKHINIAEVELWGLGVILNSNKSKSFWKEGEKEFNLKKLSTMKLEYEKLLYNVKFKLFGRSLIT